MVEETQPMRRSWFGLKRQTREDEPLMTPGPDPETEARPWSLPPAQTLKPILIWGLGFLLVLAISVAGSAYFALYQGERDRTERRETLAEQHYQKGLQRLDAGEFELAIAEFEYVLKLDPHHPTAAEGVATARERRDTIPTTTPTVEATEVYTFDVGGLYQEAFTHYEAGEWEEAIEKLTQVRVLDPAYQSGEVEKMLFNSLYNAGMALLENERFEKGVFYLDQAVALRPLDEEALYQRQLAVKYMSALSYWGVDWERCIKAFEELYATAPNYHDVFRRLYRAHVSYAEAWYEQGEMCPAELEYGKALQLMNDTSIEQKRAQANQICLVATPTPVSSITGTVQITLTEAPQDFTVGRLAYPNYNPQTGVYDVYALFADGRLIRMAGAADQPTWVGGSGALAYRDLLSPGVALLGAGESAGRTLRTGAGLAWPTFSPDGSRMAYAEQSAGGQWHIYLAPTDGSTEPVRHAQGKGPAWSATGLLAWTGCDDAGCGIFVDNPDDEQPGTLLTASASDIGLNWSPNGELIAYMSDVSGDWDVYLLNITGGVIKLTDNPASDGLPTWAPNGAELAFVSNRDGIWGIYLMEPNGENQRQMLTLGPNLPSWQTQRLSWAW
jgi:tetratricopeptide (TPR) repeat protein